MTEKRFYVDTIDGGESVLTDNGKELSLNETCNLLNGLNNENEELQFYLELNETNNNYVIKQLKEEIKQWAEENKELQERNNRQAKQLDDLYRLIEQRDWRALSDIMDDFQKAEEQLQKEWKCYE